jgi:mannosyltransferase
VPALVAWVVLLVWLPPIRSSLWCDELETFWVVKDGPAAVFHRVFDTGRPGSLVYFLLESLVVRHVGSSEVVLRLPSLAAMLATAYLVFRLARRAFGDARVGWISTLVFACQPGVAFAAIDARWYAFSTLAVAGAAMALLRWLETGRARDGALYVVLAALSIHLHFLTAVMLAVHAIWIFVLRDGQRVTWRGLGVAALAIGLLVLPGLFQVRGAARVFFAKPPTPDTLLLALVPPIVWFPLVIAALVSLERRRAPADDVPPFAGRTLAMLLALLAWAVVPPFALFVVSHVTPFSIFVPRYYLCCAPAIAVLAGVVLRRLPDRARFGVLLVLVAIETFRSPSHGIEDYRAALAYVRSEQPRGGVLLMTPLIEGRDPAWWRSNEERRSLLSAPLSYYPAGGTLRLVARDLSSTTIEFNERVVADEIAGGAAFTYVAEFNNPSRCWILGRMSGAGWRVKSFMFGAISVDVFSPKS